jgi:signal peptidase II
MRRQVILILTVLGIAGCDVSTKRLAEDSLAGQPPVTIIPGAVELSYTENPGVAFNLERVAPPPVRRVLVFAIPLALVGFMAWLLFSRRGLPAWQAAAYAIVLGGAAGNLIDRVALGHVVDFIHVRGWPVFNVADIAVVGGALMLLLVRSRSGSPPLPTGR